MTHTTATDTPETAAPTSPEPGRATTIMAALSAC